MHGVEPGGVEDRAAGVLGGVAVAPAEPPGDDAAPAGPGGDGLGHGLVHDVGVDGVDTSAEVGAVRPQPVRSGPGAAGRGLGRATRRRPMANRPPSTSP